MRTKVGQEGLPASLHRSADAEKTGGRFLRVSRLRARILMFVPGCLTTVALLSRALGLLTARIARVLHARGVVDLDYADRSPPPASEAVAASAEAPSTNEAATARATMELLRMDGPPCSDWSQPSRCSCSAYFWKIGFCNGVFQTSFYRLVCAIAEAGITPPHQKAHLFPFKFPPQRLCRGRSARANLFRQRGTRALFEIGDTAVRPCVLAQNGDASSSAECLLSEVKRTVTRTSRYVRL